MGMPTVKTVIQANRQTHNITDITIIEGFKVHFSGTYGAFLANCDIDMVMFRNALLKREVAGTYLLNNSRLYIFLVEDWNNN